MDNKIIHTSDLLEKLKLKYWAGAIGEDLKALTPSEQDLICSYMNKWANVQLARKKEVLIASRIQSARFGKIETIDGFDFNYNRATQKIKNTYLSLMNSISREAIPSAVFVGHAGLGKTRLARSLGYAACQQELTVLFTTASQMVNRLATANKMLTLEQEIKKHRRPQVLIIDELGYVTMGQQESNLFFQVISARHDQGLGTIVTTNLPFGKYNQIFASDAVAHAIVDRIVADADVFFLEGESYRAYSKKLKNKTQ